jgi:hypothetical protein
MSRANLGTRRQKMVLKLIGVLAAVGMLFGASFGAAAGLDVGGGSIQHGYDADLMCDEDGVWIDGWIMNVDEDEAGPCMLEGVRVKGINATECSCCDIWVVMWGDDGNTYLGKETLHIPDSIPSSGLRFPASGDGYFAGGTIPIEDIDRVDIIIEGGCPDAPA